MAGAKALEKLINTIGSGWRKEPLVCTCGQIMQSNGLKVKEVLTMLGSVSYKRSMYQCPDCGAVRYPGYAGIEVSAKDIERVAGGTGESVESWRRQLSTISEGETTSAVPVQNISYDGTGVPMVPWETEGRAGRQPDGSAKTREVKLGCVFTQTTVDDAGHPVRDPDSTTMPESTSQTYARYSSKTTKNGSCAIEGNGGLIWTMGCLRRLSRRRKENSPNTKNQKRKP
jgi:hypothetical protein